MSVCDEYALISTSSDLETSSLRLLQFSSSSDFQEIQISQPTETFDFKLENLELESKAKSPFQAHILSKSGNKNLVLWPHGGPNSCIPTSYSSLFCGLVELGYDIVIPNYIGSVGYGQNHVRGLAGHIGYYDVADSLTGSF